MTKHRSDLRLCISSWPSAELVASDAWWRTREHSHQQSYHVFCCEYFGIKNSVNHYHPFLNENCANNLEPYPYESKHVRTNRCNVCGPSMNHLHFTGFTTLDSLIKCGLVKPIAIDKLGVPLQDLCLCIYLCIFLMQQIHSDSNKCTPA